MVSTRGFPGTDCAARAANVTATSGEMSTVAFVRDHNHTSPTSRFAAPFSAARNMASSPGAPVCRPFLSFTASNNWPHA